MSKIKNSGLDQHGAKPFKQQQFGADGVGMVFRSLMCIGDIFMAMVSFKCYQHLVPKQFIARRHDFTVTTALSTVTPPLL